MSDYLNPVETKLAAARTRLILDKPFLGALVLRLPLEAADPAWCPTTATDARGVYYNAGFINELSLEQTQFMLAHEALHCALSHFARRQHRVKHRWDLACDLAINPLLLDEGLSPPPNALMVPAYRGMTAEEIYPLIEENDEREPLDNHAYDKDNEAGKGQDGTQETKPPQAPSKTSEQDPESSRQTSPQQKQGVPSPSALTPDERETLNIQWQQRLAGAAQQAMQAGKLGAALARLVDHLLQPQLPWRMLLAHYLSAMARDDYSYQRPSRREGEFILPSLRSHQVDLIVAVDTSGSINDAEIDEFVTEIDAIKGQVRARITLLACDAELNAGSPWIFEPWETFEAPQELKGGGGTCFTPVFDWVEKQGSNPELLVYLTDAEGEFPQQEPHYPVLWLVKGKLPVPWGQRIQLN